MSRWKGERIGERGREDEQVEGREDERVGEGEGGGRSSLH